MKSKLSVLVCVASLVTTSVMAQDEAPNRGPRRERAGQAERGPGEGGRPENQRRMAPPLMLALDANQDGVIDAVELKNASAALTKLDKNGDGKLTQEELRPNRPEGQQGPPEGQEGRPGRANRRPPGAPEGQ